LGVGSSAQASFAREFYLHQKMVGARSVFMIVQDPGDMKAARALQDAIKVEQARTGSFEAPI
jgi:hypothetical protein